MVRFAALALASALLATPVLGVDSLIHSVAAQMGETKPAAEVVATQTSTAGEAVKAEAPAPACERTVRVVYAGMNTAREACRLAR